ncbi:hypothetical protein ACQP3J_34120, partial [Escherichia coli]
LEILKPSRCSFLSWKLQREGFNISRNLRLPKSTKRTPVVPVSWLVLAIKVGDMNLKLNSHTM